MAFKGTKSFNAEVKSAAARVMFSSASVGGLSWSSLLGAKNDLKLAIAKTLFEHGDLPKTGPIEIARFETSDDKLGGNEISFNYDPGTAATHTWKQYGSYVVTDVHSFTYNGKEYPLEFGPIFKSDNIHYDYSLKGDYNPF
ncbi:MAG: hypothetical protein WC500_05035 [Candidatus Margulisiibacteriota bacterium]